MMLEIPTLSESHLIDENRRLHKTVKRLQNKNKQYRNIRKQLAELQIKYMRLTNFNGDL